MKQTGEDPGCSKTSPKSAATVSGDAYEPSPVTMSPRRKSVYAAQTEKRRKPDEHEACTEPEEAEQILGGAEDPIVGMTVTRENGNDTACAN